jgi:general secretion pathway protein K
VQELWLVLGLPPALVERAISYVTVFGDRPEINVFEAAPEVVASIPGMTPAGVARFLKERGALPHDKESIAQYFGTKPGVASFQGSNIIRIRTEIAFDNGSRSGAEAVILMHGDVEPYKILSWQDDADSFAKPVFRGSPAE